MIVVNDVHAWHLMLPGSTVDFLNMNARAATIDFNVAGVADIYIQLRDEKGEFGEPVLLAHVEGRDTVKFAVPTGYRIINKSEDVDVFVFSRDGSKVHRTALDEDTYTTLHEPRVRDENLERIVAQMNRGVERRLAAQKAQFERELQIASERASAPVDSPTGDSSVKTEPVVKPPKSGEGDVKSDDAPTATS